MNNKKRIIAFLIVGITAIAGIIFVKFNSDSKDRLRRKKKSD